MIRVPPACHLPAALSALTPPLQPAQRRRCHNDAHLTTWLPQRRRYRRPCGSVADGQRAQAVIAELLARPEVELVHLRNVGYGCYNFAVRANGG